MTPVTSTDGRRARPRWGWSAARSGAAGLALAGAIACGGTPTGSFQRPEITCDLNRDLLFSSLPPDAIPAVNGPEMVGPGEPEASYLRDDDRVLGVVMEGEARAYPHNILWHHEIVNDVVAGRDISVTFCPLTGSGLAFRPDVGGRNVDLGVSGLLFANNLVMYDRDTGEVYGPQLAIEGRCESFRGLALDLMPVQETSWGRWKALHPDTKVVSGELGFSRNYRFYPYRDYDQLSSNELLFPMTVDETRPIKERVLAVRSGLAGRGYPFGELEDMGEYVAINEVIGGIPTAVLYESTGGQTALAFDARIDGQTLTFDATPGGAFVDVETQSTWRIDGLATAGPLAGRRLETRADAYTLFWFAWRHFQPNGQVFAAP